MVGEEVIKYFFSKGSDFYKENHTPREMFHVKGILLQLFSMIPCSLTLCGVC